jgi:uncharacterized protein (TIGR00645 family)
MAEPPTHERSPFERGLGLWLFRSRWLMAPFYLGLVFALAMLLVAFILDIVHECADLPSFSAERAIAMVLLLIDLSLVGNLLVIVIFSGFENFVAKIKTTGDADRPEWMGTIDFSGMKMKLISSIVAISTVALLRAFIDLTTVEEGEVVESNRLAWLLGIHGALVVTGVLFALMDYLASRIEQH